MIATEKLEKAELGARSAAAASEAAREILATSLYPASPEGSTPDAVAVAPDGKTLYVANADNNDVMVVDISEPGESGIAGFIPVGWYPTALAVSPDSRNAAGGQRQRAPLAAKLSAAKCRRKPPSACPSIIRARLLEGSIAVIAAARRGCNGPIHAAGAEELALHAASSSAAPPANSDCCIPDKTGGECPIKYVLYIIKENRTYDQVFGDFKDAQGQPGGQRRSGAGDVRRERHAQPSPVGPRLRALGQLLLQRRGERRRPRLVRRRDRHRFQAAGLDHALLSARHAARQRRHGRARGRISVGPLPPQRRDVQMLRRRGVRVPKENRGTWKPGRDKDRVQGWINDLHAGEKDGTLAAAFHHVAGRGPYHGHRAGQADARRRRRQQRRGFGPDRRSGQPQSACGKRWRFSSSRTIPRTGPTTSIATARWRWSISPWAKRGTIDSTHYTQASMVRTIELILGLPPMTQYDAAATPLFGCFQNKHQLVAYQPLQPKVNLNAINGLNAFGARSRRRWISTTTTAPTRTSSTTSFGRWPRGRKRPYPPIVRRVPVRN